MTSVNASNVSTVNYVPVVGVEMDAAGAVENEATQPLTVSEGGAEQSASVPVLDEVDAKVLAKVAELSGRDYEALIELLSNKNAETNIKVMIETLEKRLEALRGTKSGRMAQADKFLGFMGKNAETFATLNKLLETSGGHNGYYNQLAVAECLMKLTMDITGQDLPLVDAKLMARSLLHAIFDSRCAVVAIAGVAHDLFLDTFRMGREKAKEFATMMTGVLSLSVAQATVTKTTSDVQRWYTNKDVAEWRLRDELEEVSDDYSRPLGWLAERRWQHDPFVALARASLVSSFAASVVENAAQPSKPAKWISLEEREEFAKEISKNLAKLVSAQSKQLAVLDQLVASLEESLNTLVGILGQVKEMKATLEDNPELQDAGVVA